MKAFNSLLVFFLIIGTILIANSVMGEQNFERKLNPYTGKLETVARDSVLKYNPHSGAYEYAPPNATPQYNPHTGNWGMAPPSNPHSGEASPDSRFKYDLNRNNWYDPSGRRPGYGR